jgi:hypothetical protein
MYSEIYFRCTFLEEVYILLSDINYGTDSYKEEILKAP